MGTRSISSAMLLLVLLVCVGCTSSNAPSKAVTTSEPASSGSALETTPSPLEFAETGFRVVDDRVIGVDYGFLLKNPNLGAGAESATVRMTMRDAAGTVLGTEDVVVERIMPGATVALGGENADPHGTVPVAVDFEVLDTGIVWKAAGQMGPADFKPLTVTDQKASIVGVTTSFTGQLTNPNNAPFKRVCVSLLLRDASGKIVWGGYDVREDLAANATVPYRADVMSVREYGSFELYAQPW
jgi:hypothetical protein